MTLNLPSKKSKRLSTEYLFLEIAKDNLRYLIGGFYRHPSSNISDFCSKLENLFQSQSFRRSKLTCILAGDFNVDLLKYDTHSDVANFIDILVNYNFLPLTVIPTRVTDSTATIIDHIYFRPTNGATSNIELALNGCLTVDISDH